MNFSYIVFAFVWPIRTSKVNLPRLPERKGGKTKTGRIRVFSLLFLAIQTTFVFKFCRFGAHE